MPFVALLTVITLAAGGAQPAAVDSILIRYVDALGGRVAIERVVARSYRGMMVHDVNWHDPPHHEAPFVADHRGKGTFRYADSADPADLLEVEPQNAASRLDWLLHPRSALVIDEYLPDLEVAGHQVRDGHEVVVLLSPQAKTENWALYFDTETGLLNNVGYKWWLEDYRKVDGVLFPHRIVIGRKGGSSTYVIEEIVTEMTDP